MSSADVMVNNDNSFLFQSMRFSLKTIILFHYKHFFWRHVTKLKQFNSQIN